MIPYYLLNNQFRNEDGIRARIYQYIELDELDCLRSGRGQKRGERSKNEKEEFAIGMSVY